MSTGVKKSAATVFVVDDDDGFLKAITRFLRAHDYEVQCYSSATDFLAQLPTHAAGCVVTDLRMPGMNGLELQLALTESDTPLPIVFLTGHGDIPTSVKAMRSGAEDFLIKTGPKEDLLSAIERALLRDIEERKNRMYQHALSMRFAKLTPREKEVLTHVLRGRLNKQIAADLGIDERSVKRHRTHLMNKLEITSVAELGQLAARAGISDMPNKKINEYFNQTP